MSFTDGKWEQGTSQSDMQFFIGFDDFQDTLAHATFGSAGAGLISSNLASTLAGTFFSNVQPFLRTGVLATPAIDQEQFGTAAGVPGPSSVAGTSGPLALKPGYPPILGASMGTLVGGGLSGAIPKGMQFDSIDVIYAVNTVNASLATIGLTTTKFVDNTAPLVANLIALGANGLPVAFRAQPYVFNIAVPTPAMIIAPDTEVIININLTAGSGGTINLYGVVFKCHFNFN